jgi:two-component sensor histidine kinase
MSERASRPPARDAAPVPDDDASGQVEDLRAQLARLQRQLEQSERARRESAERENLLRAEVQHRVRNMLAIIRSLFSRTVALGDPLDHVSDHFQGRLDAVARFQVARGIDPRATFDLEDMFRDELMSFEFDTRIEIAGPDVPIPQDVAQSLGLAIHELATNSIKFGALSTSDERTRLKIAWTCSDGLLVIDWEETGTAVISPAPVRTGFGREFIEQGLPYQIAATTAFELKPGGLSCRIALALDQCAANSPLARNWF